ncbi:hypothetical protein MIB92_11215 [Aestuariirhabdus sp. Z084]|uniref:hypothetical protein n=1 Tax=Aestuariirhabdus haliotis TaxID=2918751 RepID=UPI00201B3685|nr:hypothetical protein [Aestuariirhabdus haliotis]MCL6416222.1 hypothetical protein [Aestuariirhabdus haliotis]MCL6420318.1 hypothetical protein [Aestuariirhabdus haliotis]
MNSISGTNPYVVAPGTPNSAVRPEAGLTYEESNARLDQLGDSINQAQATRDSINETQRTAFLGVNQAQAQQNQIDIYTSTYSGNESSSSSNSLTYSDIQDISRTVAVSNGAPPPAVVEQQIEQRVSQQPTPGELLQGRIQEAYDQPVTIQPVEQQRVDITV